MEINGFENYLIYPNGKVYSKVSKRYLKECLSKAGYFVVNLGRNNQKYIHRLLAEHFIENPNGYDYVDHYDRNTKNNKLNNLRWVTHTQNCNNRGVYKTNSSGIENICYDKNKQRWKYQKIINGEKHQRRFKTLEQAIEYKTNYEKNL